jgi:3-oxoacyl-[acyl-carrier-protein] synthase-1
VSVLTECLAHANGRSLSDVPVFLAIAEPDRPGRVHGLEEVLDAAAQRMGLPVHPDSRLLAQGRTGGVRALELARKAVAEGHRAVIVAGVDGFLASQTLRELDQRRRLLTAENSDGFIPGEAAAAVLVGPAIRTRELHCIGIGYGQEPAPVESERPLRAEGLAAAYSAALADAKLDWRHIDYRMAGVSGDQYGFKETALAAARTIRPVKEKLGLQHPADCIGEVGAAIVPCMLGVARAALRKRYAPGRNAMCHVGDDDGRRGALVLSEGSQP